MKRNLKRSAIAIPVAAFAALILGAFVFLPGASQQVQAQAQGSTDNSMTATMSSSGMALPGHAVGRTILIHITSGDPKDIHQVHAATMGVDHAFAFLKSGKNVAILLDVDGVRIATKAPPTELQAINSELQSFLTAGGRVIACEHCIMTAGLQTSDMLPGVEIDSHPLMPRTQSILDSGAQVLDY